MHLFADGNSTSSDELSITFPRYEHVHFRKRNSLFKDGYRLTMIKFRKKQDFQI